MTNIIIISVIGLLIVSQILQWIVIINHKREMKSIWHQIRDLANNTAKQIVILRNDFLYERKNETRGTR